MAENEFLGREVVVVEGCRIPFLRSNTHYQDLMGYQLGAMAIKGLFQKTGPFEKEVERVVLGTVTHNNKTPNLAREAAIIGGIPEFAPATTVSMACISANAAICQAADWIRTGQYEMVVAGGTDCLSDIPIPFRKEMRKKLFKAQKVKSSGDMVKMLAHFRPKDFVPEFPQVAEFLTGMTMGEDCDKMAAKFEISRKEQDEFAVRSHQLALAAQENGWLGEEVAAAEFPPAFHRIVTDNGIRPDSSVSKLSKLPPVFDKKYGSLTAGNSSFLTDGAAVVLLMSKGRAEFLGLQPKAVIRGYTFVGRNPEQELLLGPAYAIPKVLKVAGLKLSDIDVFEFHEAFAAQVLSNLRCLDSQKFAENLGLSIKIGEVPIEKLNAWGGSLAIGHPFGATGARLLTTAVNRLGKEQGEWALLASCAAGGLGHAMLVQTCI
ncbi:acetyl-CoA C-acyltransferase [Rapidithrix thailandica]|uniref:acetyl-CoA C-acyltransferase n=1 Tax=Rapidithrix thailandica TaxID=413964 RepID=A0AAW9S079_9BACT